MRASLTARGRKEFDAKQARFTAALARELADLDAKALEGAAVVLERLAHYFDGL